MAGFRFRYRLNGGSPTVRAFRVKSAGVLTDGDMVNLEAGEVDLGVTGDKDLVGVVLEPLKATGSLASIRVITDNDAVYGVDDDEARDKDETLDLIGATGGQGVARGPTGEFVVVARSSAGAETLVRIIAGPRPERSAGELNSAIARAIVAIHHRHVGRGPTKAQAFFRGATVVIVLQDAMTTAERNLVTAGRQDAVLDLRRQLQLAMREDMTAAVEMLTGRKVVAFMSDNHVDPDLAAEVLVLDRPVTAAS